MAAQLSMEAALPLAKSYVTASCRSSIEGPGLRAQTDRFQTRVLLSEYGGLLHRDDGENVFNAVCAHHAPKYFLPSANGKINS